MRLYQFDGMSNAAAKAGVVKALTHKFGQPTTSAGYVQNGFGAIFTSSKSKWSNPRSVLWVESRYSAIDNLKIMMIDLRLKQAADRLTKAAELPQRNPI